MCQEDQSTTGSSDLKAHVSDSNMALALSRGRIREPEGSLKQQDFFKPPGRTGTDIMISYSTVR